LPEHAKLGIHHRSAKENFGKGTGKGSAKRKEMLPDQAAGILQEYLGSGNGEPFGINDSSSEDSACLSTGLDR
jgi:hypothetical protein